MILPADFVIIESRLGVSRLQPSINRNRHFKIAVDQAISKLDLQRMQMPAVTDSREAAGIDRLARNTRNNRLNCPIGRMDNRRAQEAGEEQRKVTNAHKTEVLLGTRCRVEQRRLTSNVRGRLPPRRLFAGIDQHQGISFV